MNKPKLKTYKDLLNLKKTTIVELQSGDFYEIKVLQPGDFLAIIGSPITKQFFYDPQGKFGPPQIGSDVEKVELATKMHSDEDFMKNVKALVCRGVVNVNFVMKHQSDCDEKREELSIDLLDFADLMDLLGHLMIISNSEEEVKDFYTFRESVLNEQSGGNQDTSAC